MKKIIKQISAIMVIILVLVITLNFTYEKIGFGYFSKAANCREGTIFSRDSKEKYSKENSYKIENKEYNNATFYRTIHVKKNTPYKVTCMVKTENVESNTKNNFDGAKISLLNRAEKSAVLTGNNDWTELTIMFNSKNNETIDIAFSLGNSVKGIAWFSNINFTEGSFNSSNWNFACFIFKKIDVNINGQQYKYEMTTNDIKKINECMERFIKKCEFFSAKNMSATYKIIEINEPITRISYDKEKGYYISGQDVENLIRNYIEKEHFDYIYSCIRMSDENSKIPSGNWVGLGSMEYNEVGFSNIKMPDNPNSKELEYDENYNRFPEEVFLHEFLHTLESNSKECGFNAPNLHDNLKYGYEKKAQYGLFKWYYDYMQNNVKSVKGSIGINQQLYYIKPVSEECFKKAINNNQYFEEPNMFEKAKVLFKMII